jgi:phenylacetate-coenzyme A ligase PaaK-like adenylate-forming protein
VSLSFIQQFKASLFNTHPQNFESKALALFRFQAQHNPVYKAYLQHLRINIHQINAIHQIPFLPIEFFKTQQVITGNQAIETIFESSGTTGQIASKHLVADTEFYKTVSRHIFESRYGLLQTYHILALLPSYLERNNSSLVYMINHFIMQSGSTEAGFFLHNHKELIHTLQRLQNKGEKIILLGVTFALLDLAETVEDMDLSGVIIMETGGMKGRREELLREELHDKLTQAFHVEAIHAEYGMTELLSQAYSTGRGIFETPPWMRILIRDINDPFLIDNKLKSGGVNIIDLANVDSCAFIETKDIGTVADDNTFKILGRFDNSDIRGCNLMVV